VGSLGLAGFGEFRFLLRDRKNSLVAEYELISQKALTPFSKSRPGPTGGATFTDFTTAHETRIVDFGVFATLTIPSITPKPGILPSSLSRPSIDVSYNKGTILAGRQTIKDLDNGALSVSSSLLPFNSYTGPFTLLTKCLGGSGADRF
jgi:hypothetical protein